MCLQALAAGSLRLAWRPLMAQFERETGLCTRTQFAPAGMLRMEIEAGKHCDLFASANLAHPQALLTQGHALAVRRFAGNTLCLTVAARYVDAHSDWLSLLLNPALRIAASTPGSDPAGDYAWQLFEKLDAQFGVALQRRVLSLVGGPNSQPVPAGEVAAAWLINSGQADLFIGYRSYGEVLQRYASLRVLEIPLLYNIRANYGVALCNARATPLWDFLGSASAQEILQQQGFMA